MKKYPQYFLITIVFIASIATTHVAAQPKVQLTDETPTGDTSTGWTFLINIESDHELSYWAVKNINAMARAVQDSNVNILVQLNMEKNGSQSRESWRYRIGRESWVLEDTVPVTTDRAGDLVSSMRWAVKDYPAKRYCLVLWANGFGIIEPTGGLNQPGSVDYAITTDVMVRALREISVDLLDGRRVDVLGTDCCKMAMIEVGYPLEPYVDYLIGSQNCELPDGWHYEGIFTDVKGQMSPKVVSKIIVDMYAKYHCARSNCGLYTLSALDLNCMNKVVNDINTIGAVAGLILVVDPHFNKVVAEARSRSVAISDVPYYTDLDSFYTQLLVEVNKKRDCDERSPLLNLLADVLVGAKEHMKDLVAANCTGARMQDARGASIYFPQDGEDVDESYFQTPFAKDTRWVEFLKAIGANLSQ